MKIKLMIILTAVVALSLVGCSQSPEGKYVLEGNDKVYLELKPLDSKTGTVQDRNSIRFWNKERHI